MKTWPDLFDQYVVYQLGIHRVLAWATRHGKGVKLEVIAFLEDGKAPRTKLNIGKIFVPDHKRQYLSRAEDHPEVTAWMILNRIRGK